MAPAGAPEPSARGLIRIKSWARGSVHVASVATSRDSGIDFCCQGARTLREACQRKGIAVDAVLGQLEAEAEDPRSDAPNPAELPPHAWVAHIVATHHAFLRRELPRLHAMAERVANVRGGHTPSWVEMFAVYRAMEDELNGHLLKEEQILFPVIVGMSLGELGPVPVDGPVACMLHEHDDAGAALARLRELSHGFEPPLDACNTYRALFAGLRDLEEDLHRHIHLENAVLFPEARALSERTAVPA